MKFLIVAISLAIVSANVDVRPSGLTVETLFKPGMKSFCTKA